MIKDIIMRILDQNEESIKISFKIDDGETKKIRKFLNTKHKDFRAVIDDMVASNLNDRGKMAVCCIMGYANGITNSQFFNNMEVKK